MTTLLQHLVESQRRLLHDVSHELRWPLARLQAAWELLLQQPERAQEFIARIQRDTGRVDALVGELLTLSRLDGGTESLRLEPFDPDELVADIVADVSFEAEMKGCRVELRSETDMQIAADLEFSRRAIENVLRNAIRHAPPGSVVGITVVAAPGRLLITIRDRGAGVPEAELETIFQPFHRAENARPFEGYGLGLAIIYLAVERVFGAKETKAPLKARTDAALALVGLTHAGQKRPGEIPGSMKQRVGIARALSMEPQVLLMDEPFGALDALTRAKLQDELLEIGARTQSTVVMVTHDVDEAVLLSDKIVMMANGPAATIGEVLSVDLPRPRKRVELAEDPQYVHYRKAVIDFLYTRQGHVEKAA